MVLGHRSLSEGEMGCHCNRYLKMWKLWSWAIEELLKAILVRVQEGKKSFEKASSSFIVVQSPSRVRFCDPTNCSVPGLPVHHCLLELGDIAQTHVH